MSDYDPAVRPALSPRHAVNVTLGTGVMTIISLHEKSKVLTTEAWLRQTWVDVQLRWNASDFGGLEEIRIPVVKIWTPEIVLFNNADDSFRSNLDKLVVVKSNGRVTWIPHVRLRSFCDIDLTLFPYDTQTCRLYLGSATYDETLVSLGHLDRNLFLPTANEWDLLDFQVGVFKITDGVKYYPTVMYSISMKRVSVFYKYMLVGPSVILAALTLLLFWIPADSNERFMLATGILVSLTVLFLLLEQYLPTDIGKLPTIASYLQFNFVLLLITIVISVLTFNCQYRGVKSGAVPSWIRWVFLGRLSRVMCVKVRPYMSSHPNDVASTVEAQDARRELQGMLSESHGKSSDGEAQGGISALARSSNLTIEKTMEEIRLYLRYLVTKSETTGNVAPHSELVMNEWLQVALVIDRLTFWIFLFISVITTLAIYGRA